MLRFGWCILAFAISACSASDSGKGSQSPTAQHVAPDVSVKLTNGDTFHPRDALGKVLVIDFWTTWCAPCRTSLPALDAIYKKQKAAGLMVVSINEDGDPPKAKALVAEARITYPVGLDEDGAASRAFGVETMPSAFVIDRRGVIRYVHLGYPPNESERLDKEIQELLAETP
jgi:peroxiredoxin